MKRPLLLPALLIAAGIMGAELSGGSWQVAAMASVVAWLAALWPPARTIALGAGFFAVGRLAMLLAQASLAPHDLRRISGTDPEIVTLRGTILETPTLRLVERKGTLAGRTLVRVGVTALRRGDGWQPAIGDVAVGTAGALSAEFFRTQRIEVTGVLRLPPGPVAEGLFDYRAALRLRGVWRTLLAEGPADWRPAPDAVAAAPWSERFLPWAQAMLSRGLPDDEATRLLAAMALGWKTPLTGEVDDVFMQSGTMHVFAISGLHIALIAGLLVRSLRLVRLSRAGCGVVAVPLIWAYVGATGWQPSAIRSAIMSTVVVGGWALERPSDLVNSLAAAAIAVLLWDPGQLFQAGFQLSFGAVAGLALLVPRLEPLFLRWLRLDADPFLPDELRPGWRRRLDLPLRWLALSMATCVGAFVTSLPLTWHHFHLLNPVSLIANLVVVPLSSFALAANFASLATGPWWSWLGEVFNASAWVWMKGMIALSRFATEIPGGHWYVASPAWAWWVPYYALLIGVVTGGVLRPVEVRWWGCGTAIWLGAASVAWMVRQGEASITVLGGGEAVLVDAPWHAEDILLDAGDLRSGDGLVVPFLHVNGFDRLPFFAATRGDVRHLGGAPSVVAMFLPRCVVFGPENMRSRPLGELRRTSAALGLLSRIVASGERVAGWEVLHPVAGDRFAKLDDNGLVLVREIGGVRVLWLADLGREGQRSLLGRGEARADVVVGGMPSDGAPLGDPLLLATGARLVVVASGERATQARTKEAVRRRFAERDVPVIFTADSGAVTLRIRDGVCEAVAMDGTRIRVVSAGRDPRAAGAPDGQGLGR